MHTAMQHLGEKVRRYEVSNTDISTLFGVEVSLWQHTLNEDRRAEELRIKWIQLLCVLLDCWSLA